MKMNNRRGIRSSLRNVGVGVLAGLAGIVGVASPTMADVEQERQEAVAQYVEANSVADYQENNKGGEFSQGDVQGPVGEPEAKKIYPRIAVEAERKRTITLTPEEHTITVAGQDVTFTTNKREVSHSGFTTYTFGLSDNGDWNNEWLRMYDKNENFDGENIHYTEVGIRQNIPIGALKNEITVFGAEGDYKDFGVQVINHLDGDIQRTQGGTFLGCEGLDITWNVERTFVDEGDDSTRLGVGIDAKLECDLTLGGAFDTIDTPEGRTNFSLVKAIYDIGENDVVGLGYLQADSQASGTTHSVIGTYSHIGKEEKWGGRAWAKFDFNEQTDTRSATIEGILLQNPNTGRGWTRVPLSRSRGDILDGAQVAESALDFEVPQYTLWSDGGFAMKAKTSWTDNGENRDGYVRVDAGYVFGPDNVEAFRKLNTQLTFSGYTQRDFGSMEGTKYGAEAILSTSISDDAYIFLQGRMEHGDLSFSDGSSSDSDTFYAYVGASFALNTGGCN